MTRSEAVVFAFLSVGEAAEAVQLAQSVHQMAATSQDFMWIRLLQHCIES